MKSIAFTLLAAILASGCATEDSTYPSGGRGLRPAFKPAMDPDQFVELSGGGHQNDPAAPPGISETLQLPTPRGRDPRLEQAEPDWADNLEIQLPAQPVRDPLLDQLTPDWAEDVVINGMRLERWYIRDARTGAWVIYTFELK